MATASRMSRPPIVGVPALARCDFGPSSRIDWPICAPRQPADHRRAERRARSSSAVTAAIAVRNVM